MKFINYWIKYLININNETKTGKCNSIPKILEDGRIELLEKWEWTNGDKSKGESKIIEINKSSKTST